MIGKSYIPSTHEEWLKCLQNDGDRKIICDEINGETKYWEVIEGEQSRKLVGGEGETAKRNRKAREQMAKKVSKENKPYTWQLGYNHCIGRRPGDEEYPRFSGSSLNRRPKVRPPEEKKEDGPSYGIHYLSSRSRSKVRDKATAFYRAGSGNRIFVTLTFISEVTDQQGVEILNKFLTVVRKEHPQIQYLWVAEHQKLTRSTIHFHMIMNRRLPVRRYNALWVLQQYNAGLTAKNKYGEIIDRAEIEERYRDGTVGKVLNPFDVERVKTIYGISYYLTKYITKQEKDDPFGCQTWHCSRRVSRLFTKTTVSPSTFRYMRSFKNYKVDKKTGECFPSPIYQTPFFVMTYVNNKASPLVYLREFEQVNKWLLQGFDPGKLPALDDIMYRRLHCSEQALKDPPNGKKKNVTADTALP